MDSSLADHMITRYRWMLLLGMILIGLSQAYDGLGMFTGNMAIMLGGCGGSFGRYRRESGLWMLSGMFLAISCAFLAIFGVVAISGGVRAGLPSPSACDLSAAAIILVLQAHFLWTITRTNWVLSHGARNA